MRKPKLKTDGQQVGGTHPTGMHSCYFVNLQTTRMHSSRMRTDRGSSHLGGEGAWSGKVSG